MRRIKKKIKRYTLSTLAFPLVVRGYAKGQAKDWVRESVRDIRRQDGVSISQKRWAQKRGFTSNQAFTLGVDRDNLEDFISYRDYKFIQPVSGKYSKWINDKITIRNIFKPFARYLPECYYQLSTRDGETQIFALQDCPPGHGEDVGDILRLIREKKYVVYGAAGKSKGYLLSYEDEKYFMSGEEIDHDSLVEYLLTSRVAKDEIRLISEYIKAPQEMYLEKEGRPATLRLYIVNSEGDNPVIGDAFLFNRLVDEETEEKTTKWSRVDLETGAFTYETTEGNIIQRTIPHLDEIKAAVKEIGHFVPQIEFMGATVYFTKDSFKFQWFNPTPSYLRDHHFSPVTVAYLRQKVKEKREAYEKASVRFEEGKDRIFRTSRKQFTKAFFPKGMLPYLGPRWIYNVFNDYRTNKDATAKEKLWAYRRGFLSYRLKQYGIDESTVDQYISDFEYMWMRHINPRHKAWFEDKITIKYILSDFKENFPEYYYHITVKNGQNKVIPMMDCPKGFQGTYDDIFRLADEMKILALKPDEGSHGEGFFKLEAKDQTYFLNGEEASRERIIDLLQDVDNQYLITEYIQMHPDLKKIYPNSVNTLRLTVWKKDGKHPTLGNGYMRFGSSKTGVVDNVGAGGIGVDLDVQTGRFYNARIIENNSTLVPTPIHPDTGEKIEGFLPNWEYIRERILTIAASVPQVEYLGFDVAVTENGIKFPEINRFPDYPRINPLTPETMDYLLTKLEARKEKFEYVERQPSRMFKLPKRESREK